MSFRALAISLSVSTLMFLVLSIVTVQAESPEEFYKGKTLNILVGSSAGGGYDRYSRLFARHFPKHLSGDPTMIVRNMPGAGSLKAVLFTNEAAPKDGTYMTAFNSGIMIEAIAAGKDAKANFTEYAFIGNITRSFRLCFTRKERGIGSWDAFVKREKIVFGATGPKSGSYNDAAMLKNLFNLPIQIITAYPGTSEMYLASERGEVDGGCVSWESLPADWLQNDSIDVVVKLANATRPQLKGSPPFVRDVAKTKEQQDVLQVLLAPAEIGRPIIMSKDVPADRIAYVRKMFLVTMKDPDFIADATKSKLEVDPVSGEEVQDMVAKLYAIAPETVAKAKQALE